LTRRPVDSELATHLHPVDALGLRLEDEVWCRRPKQRLEMLRDMINSREVI